MQINVRTATDFKDGSALGSDPVVVAFITLLFQLSDGSPMTDSLGFPNVSDRAIVETEPAMHNKQIAGAHVPDSSMRQQIVAT